MITIRQRMRHLGRKAYELYQAGVFLAVAASVLGFLGSFSLIFDLMSHFRLFYAFVIGFGLALALINRQKRMALAWAVGFGLNAAVILPLFVPNREPSLPDVAPLRVMFVNVFRGNEQKQAVIDAVKGIDPDILVVVEVDHEWIGAIESALSATWPHHVEDDRNDNFGIALFAKTPLASAKVFESPGSYVPTVRVETSIRGRPFVLYGTHPFPPVSPVNQANWVRHMDDLAARVREETLPVVVAGDFNSTPWSANFRGFMSATGLVDTQQGIGPQASWPAWLPVIGIPIDHVVVSPSIRTNNRRLGPHVGSDHRPVYVDLTIP